MLGDQRGAVAAELAIATPLLLLLMLTVVQFALWQHATHVAQAIAHQGLQAARVQGGTPAAGQAEAVAVFGQLGRGLLVDPVFAASGTASTVEVRVTGLTQSVVPFLRLPVRAVAVGAREQFTVSTGS